MARRDYSQKIPYRDKISEDCKCLSTRRVKANQETKFPVQELREPEPGLKGDFDSIVFTKCHIGWLED